MNGATALLFSRGKGDINIRAAFQHMLAADAVVAAAVLVFAGLVIILWTAASSGSIR